MKTRTARRASALAGALVVSLLVAGCGSSSTSTSNSATSTAAASSSGGAVDRAFVQQMVPHHEMAVLMAQQAKKHGQHRQIRALGASIIAAQEREIATMKQRATKLGVKPDETNMGGGMMGGHLSDDAGVLGMSTGQMGMSMDMGALTGGGSFDRMFIDMMIPHHQGAIRMARAELARGVDPSLRTIATNIISSQAKEIREMNTWRTRWFGHPSPAGGVPPG